jgi:hypothetical protein
VPLGVARGRAVDRFAVWVDAGLKPAVPRSNEKCNGSGGLGTVCIPSHRTVAVDGAPNNGSVASPNGSHPTLRDETAKDGAPGLLWRDERKTVADPLLGMTARKGKAKRVRVWVGKSWR